jgi:ABC-type transport system involved in cytochrome c biogenesis ATPase subunit
MSNQPGIKVEITDATEFHCFRMVLTNAAGQTIEIMLHARALVELIHEASTALSEWQQRTTSMLIQRMTGLSEEEAQAGGLIAPRDPAE